MEKKLLLVHRLEEVPLYLLETVVYQLEEAPVYLLELAVYL
jgi:hypothetical protein